MMLPSAMELQWARQRRATTKQAGGILDLVLPLRIGGDGAPLFCAHPVVGLSWCYLALLPQIGADHPVYGLQARGLRRPEPLPASMAEMAQDYADQIRIHQPDGPYHLLGWSLGANTAFAIAAELERRGHQVGLLVILDGAPIVSDTLTGHDESAWLLYNFVLAEFGYDPLLTPEDAEPEARTLELIGRKPGLGLQEWPERRVLALMRVIRNNVTVTRAWRPERVHCPVLFCSATQTPPSLSDKLAAWRQFADGPIESLELDCRHRHLLLPEPVAAIGAAVTERLNRTVALPV
jgi:thioesterase domain-containing protein